LAKQDIADATAQGVLRPPPQDAGTIKRFTHQAIELFVCVQTHRRFRNPNS
jgi:LETM1 and EF-hand domain-containing protein 1